MTNVRSRLAQKGTQSCVPQDAGVIPEGLESMAPVKACPEPEEVLIVPVAGCQEKGRGQGWVGVYSSNQEGL